MFTLGIFLNQWVVFIHKKTCMGYRYDIITSHRDYEVLVILTSLSRSQKDFKCSCGNWRIFRPNLIDYTNISKLLGNSMSRYINALVGIQGGGNGLVRRAWRGISFSLKKKKTTTTTTTTKKKTITKDQVQKVYTHICSSNM